MVKPRLLVLAKELHEYQGNLENSLFSLLTSKVAGVEVNGSVALSYSADSLLNWAILGKSTDQDQFLEGVSKRICELYVGIRTPEEEYSGKKSEDGRFDIYQLGERGFYLANQNDIPAILLDNYDSHAIYDFVKNQTK